MEEKQKREKVEYNACHQCRIWAQNAQRRRENGVATPIYGNMTPFSRRG